MPCPSSWLADVNAAQTLGELESLRRCVRRGQPFGEEHWVETTVKQLGLEAAMRPQGIPARSRGGRKRVPDTLFIPGTSTSTRFRGLPRKLVESVV